MISKKAVLRIERVPLSCLFVRETGEPWTCYPDRFKTYLELLQNNPDEDTDPLIVKPSTTHAGLYSIVNGKHRFTSSIMAGRKDCLCIVIDEPQEGASV